MNIYLSHALTSYIIVALKPKRFEFFFHPCSLHQWSYMRGMFLHMQMHESNIFLWEKRKVSLFFISNTWYLHSMFILTIIKQFSKSSYWRFATQICLLPMTRINKETIAFLCNHSCTTDIRDDYVRQRDIMDPRNAVIMALSKQMP